MNYYKHYIGDFQRDTSHLSLTERGAYLALIHHYYATELPLPAGLDALCRIAGAMTKAERDAVKSVMGFFEPVESGLMHKRIEAELGKHDDRADKNRLIALEREAKRRAQREHEESTKRAPVVHESNTNGQPIPITNNHKPLKESKALSGKPDDAPRNSELKETAVRVIEFLNAKTGKAYQPVPVNVEKVVARLREGATEQDCKSVIARKCRDWQTDDKMREYLRPATLFNREKFAQYMGQLVAPEQPKPWDGAI